jgi:hypothetical protein
MKIPEIFDDLGEYLYDDIRTLGRILQHNCLVLRTAWLRLRPQIYLLFFNVAIHMPKVKGRLKNHINFWKTQIKPTVLVLNTIEFGYVIPFFQEPVSALLKNNRPKSFTVETGEI